MRHVWRVVLFSFNDPAPTEIYTLSLHDALPIYRDRRRHVEMVSRDHHEIELGRNRGEPVELLQPVVDVRDEDRKSTRLNSSHANISYAVFCLKKKKIKQATASNTTK